MSTYSIRPTIFDQLILKWYDRFGRKHLPWQQEVTPYRVWLSEVMLQQTQVATVIDYFQRFIQEFPSIEALALAPVDHVLTLWSGLGYYSRARNLHRTAQIIHENYAGHFPKSIEELVKLPGIGRSTAGAILSLSFNQAAPILDGNVKRVLARFFAIDGIITAKNTIDELWKLAEIYSLSLRPAAYTQAMMDLGALICTRSKPKCDLCPLKKHCLAHLNQQETNFPKKAPKKIRPTKTRYFLVLQNKKGEVLLEKRPPVGIWGGLWSLPEYENIDTIENNIRQSHGYQITKIRELPVWQHTFTHYHLNLIPVLAEFKPIKNQIMSSTETIWYHNQSVGLPQPIKKILGEIRCPS